MTTTPRLFVAQPLDLGAVIEASAGQTHYLRHVLRRNTGDRVRVFNGRDGEWQASITLAPRAGITFTVTAKLRPQAGDGDLWLAFAVLKRDATDLVVQQGTELGVAALWPVFTERTNTTRLTPSRLSAIATEAAEQSERLTLPVLHPARRLPELIGAWPEDRRLFVAVERSCAPKLRGTAGRAGLLIGPEGGFTPAELEAMRPHPFVTMVSLGSHILRAETACVAGLAMLQAPGCR